MTPTRAAAIAALIASVSLTAMTPAFAEDNMQGGRKGDMRQHRMLDMRAEAGPRGGMMPVDFRCGPNAADKLDNRFDRLAGNLELTADQQKLYDAFAASALTAQTGFADTCATLKPATATATDKPDPVERMETRLKIDEARLAALTTVLPDFKAFYASLTDEQKQNIGPGGRGRGHDMGRGDMRHGNMQPGDMPGMGMMGDGPGPDGLDG
jgi:hypothetical protein